MAIASSVAHKAKAGASDSPAQGWGMADGTSNLVLKR